ncbi:isochorismatase hydrolase [Dendryphion nanum]|uniref:Isochorismatase hydrolase n=1 Tax=Dendryphion nanum TaxID=256645 RepID=A0A9P9DSF6_9PLEO|nr:isochorismatase hydrolase [Dendryphion nanum]
MTPGVLEAAVEELRETEIIGNNICAAPVSFGGDDNKWLYLPHSGKFDLSRGSSKKLTIRSDEKSQNHTGFIINPVKAVLIVVDMQNYFIHPIYRNHITGLAAVKPILKVIEQCRKTGIEIIWLNWGITEKDLHVMPPAVQRGFSKSLGWHIGLGAELPEGQGRCLFKGAWNTELYLPLQSVVEEQDSFFDKNRMSGLWSTNEPLHQHLLATGKQTLLFAGVNTDQCVLGTISDAYSYGWDCILLSDCSGTMTERGAQDLCEYNIAVNMGFVTDSRAFCKAQLS